MIDPKNLTVLTGGLVDAPELKGNNDSVAIMRVACDYAGQDQQNPDNKSGYFVVKYFLNNDTPNVKFVKKQIADGNFKKGTQLQLVGRLVQERFKTRDDKSGSAIVVHAESMTYAGSNRKADDAATTTVTPATADAPIDLPTSF